MGSWNIQTMLVEGKKEETARVMRTYNGSIGSTRTEMGRRGKN